MADTEFTASISNTLPDFIVAAMRTKRQSLPVHGVIPEMYLTCEAELDFPLPSINRLTAQLRAMYDGQSPVFARALAPALGLLEGDVMPVLRRAEQAGMIQNAKCRGWIPVNR